MWSDMDKSLSPLEMDVTYLRFGLLWTHKRNICLIGIVGWVSFKWASTTRAERLLKILHWQADFSFWPIYVNFYLGRCNVFQLLHRADVAASSQRWSWICADFLLPWSWEVHVRQISIFENEFTCVVTPIHLKIRSNLISFFGIFASSLQQLYIWQRGSKHYVISL